MNQLQTALQAHLDHKTKPPRSLGRLEELALRLGLIQGSLQPQLSCPTMVIFAGDHGAAGQGLSAYPSEVTRQMVENFLAGGAAISVLCRQLGWQLRVVDAGVRGSFPEHPQLHPAKVAPGTSDFTQGPAMTGAQLQQCLERGAALVDDCWRQGCNLLGVGEMGIGNSGSAALLTSLLLDLPLEPLVGPGTGLQGAGLQRKLQLLQQARALHQSAVGQVEPALQRVAGFEMAMLAGAVCQADRRSMAVVVDGFIATSAVLAAEQLQPGASKVCFFSHRSAEPGHALLLQSLGQSPYLDLGLRLGEGSGAALLLPLLQASLAIYHQMASFDEAGVSHALPD